MAVDAPAVEAGAFLTDGKQLVEVRSVRDKTMLCEDARGVVDVPDLTVVALSDLASGKWRVVTHA